MAFWNLSVTIGNLWVLVAKAGVQNRGHEIHRINRFWRDLRFKCSSSPYLPLLPR
jgi:hypothetical protein